MIFEDCDYSVDKKQVKHPIPLSNLLKIAVEDMEEIELRFSKANTSVKKEIKTVIKERRDEDTIFVYLDLVPDNKELFVIYVDILEFLIMEKIKNICVIPIYGLEHIAMLAFQKFITDDIDKRIITGNQLYHNSDLYFDSHSYGIGKPKSYEKYVKRVVRFKAQSCMINSSTKKEHNFFYFEDCKTIKLKYKLKQKSYDLFTKLPIFPCFSCNEIACSESKIEINEEMIKLLDQFEVLCSEYNKNGYKVCSEYKSIKHLYVEYTKEMGSFTLL